MSLLKQRFVAPAFHPIQDLKGPLPPCEGPKLEPFRNIASPITFCRLLSDKDTEGHAHIFEVTIGSTAYALKLFKFYDFQVIRGGLVGIENDLVSDDLLQAHMDPFYCECHAYGRLEEENLNGKVAVRCYGYLTFPAEIEAQLKRNFQINGFDRPGEDYRKPVALRLPIQAIIKELVREDEPLTAKTADKMLRDLKKMRSKGIYPRDIFLRNYKAGLLVDMSIARTTPHFLFDIRGPKQLARMTNTELYLWEGMRAEIGLNTRLRAVRDEKYCAKLRPRRKKRARPR